MFLRSRDHGESVGRYRALLLPSAFPRKEKLDRLELSEQLLQMRLLNTWPAGGYRAPSARSFCYRRSGGMRRHFQYLGSREERQQVRLRAHHIVEPVHRCIQERRTHELQGVPEQYSSSVSGIGEILSQEVIDPARVHLLRQIPPESLIQMRTRSCNRLCVRGRSGNRCCLVGAGAIEDRQSHHIANIKEELLQSPALAS